MKPYLLAKPTLLSLALLAGCGSEEPAPVIDTFTASAASVLAGESVTLTWAVRQATTVSVTATPGGALVDASTMLAGSATSAPLTAPATFTLVARGAGGEVTRSVEVAIRAPAEVAILRFEATPATLASGETALISYEVANATGVAITLDGGGVVLESAEPAGSVSVSPRVTSTYTLTAEGPGGPKTSALTIEVEGPPAVLTFTADPAELELGDETRLQFTTARATSIVILDEAGVEVFSGTDASGEVVVAPPADETYTLTAANAAGEEDSASVMVTVYTGARVLSFTASSTTVDFGDGAVLSYEVARATDVDLAENALTIATSTSPLGTFVVEPRETAEYTLTARSETGDQAAALTIAVRPLPPRVTSFSAAPDPVLIGTTTVLSWSVRGADDVRIEDASGLALIQRAPSVGAIGARVDSAVEDFVLIATNPHGETRESLVVTGQNIPTVDSFTVTPGTFVGSTVLTLSWETSDATAVELLVDGLPEPTFSGASPDGTFTLAVTATHELTLAAVNAVGRAETTVRVLGLDGELEPNDTVQTAQPVLGDGTGAGGTISAGGPNGDLDHFAVDVPDQGSIFAETSDGVGGCTTDTRLTLLDPGGDELGDDDDDGPGFCSQIDPRRDAFATNLPGGRYVVQVRGATGQATGPYVVLITARPPECGNGVLERGAGEQCDDGNTRALDGCSEVCAAEAFADLLGPAPSQSFARALGEAGLSDFVRITMTAPGYIHAETFVPSPDRCDTGSGASSADTELVLLDDAFDVLGSDNNGGRGLCAAIDPRFDAFAFVPAGTYWLRVHESGDNAAIELYTLVITLLEPGCSNGIIELGEDCDDANAADGDGCSAACTFEGAQELEPNDTFASGTLLVGTAPFLVHGAISPIGDSDYFLVDVPPFHHVDAYITAFSLDSCPSDPTGRVSFYDTTGALRGQANSTGGPGGNCGRAWPYTVPETIRLPAGRYAVRVNENGDNATISSYFLHLDVIAPGCRNGIIEAPELCDDGNAVFNDGCSATCYLEPSPLIDLSTYTRTVIAGSIVPSFQRDSVELYVRTETYLYAATFVDADTGSCPSIATVLSLYDEDQTSLLASDTTDGVGACSLLDPRLDPAARLAPGSYVLAIEEAGNNAEIGGYELVVQGVEVDVCGNGVREAGVLEQCDDGNLASGDGCSGACTIEPDATYAGPPAGPVTVVGALTPAGDADFIQLDLSAPSLIIAESFVPASGTCTGGADTLLRLYDGALTQLTSDDQGGIASCSRIDGLTNTAARVPAGTYYLRIEEFQNDAELPAYAIQLEVRALDTCGNGLLEGPEECDDGNLAGGDGCDGSCVFEADGVIVGPPAAVTFSGAVSPAGDRDFYRVDVSAGAILIAETGAPSAGTCAGANTILRLTSITGDPIGLDDDGGVDACSRMSGIDTAALRLAPGSYLLSVGESGDDAEVPAYELTVELRPLLACGNGLLEVPEACDDANTTDGDGCTASCELEVIAVAEQEPNGTPATANSLGTFGPGATVDVGAAILPNTDADFFTFTLSAPSSALIGTYLGAGGFLGSCPGDTELWLYDAIPGNLNATSPMVEPALVAYDDNDGFGQCSLLGGTNTAPVRLSLAAGTYWVQVRSGGSAIGGYLTRLDLD